MAEKKAPTEEELRQQLVAQATIRRGEFTRRFEELSAETGWTFGGSIIVTPDGRLGAELFPVEVPK